MDKLPISDELDTLKNFKSRTYSESDLRKKIDEVEQQRKETGVLPKIIGIIVIGLVLVVALIIATVITGYSVFVILISFVLLPIGMAFYFIYYSSSTKDYLMNYKENIVEYVVKSINPDITYSPYGGISVNLFESSLLFPDLMGVKGCTYSTWDLITTGSKGKTRSMISGFSARIMPRTRKNGESDLVIFKGLFGAYPVGMFTGKLIIKSKKLDKDYFGFVKSFKRWVKNIEDLSLLEIDNSKFTEIFTTYVHPNDEGNAKLFLTRDMQERILTFSKKTDHNLELSLIDGKLYFAISIKRHLFKPVLFRSVNLESLQDDLNILKDIININDYLGLEELCFEDKVDISQMSQYETISNHPNKE